MPCLLLAHTRTKVGVHIHHEQTHKKPIWTHTLSPTGSQPYWCVVAFLTNSCHFENYLVLELKHHSLHIHSVSSSCLEEQKLWKSFSYVIPDGRDGWRHFFLRCQASSPYNFHLQCLISTKVLIHVDSLTLNTSTHPYRVGHFEFGVHLEMLPYIILSIFLLQIGHHSLHSASKVICASKLCHIHCATHCTQEVRQTWSDCHEVYCLFSPRRDMQVTGERAVRWRCSPTHASCEGPFIAACSFN